MVTRSGWVAGKYGWPESTLPSLVQHGTEQVISDCSTRGHCDDE
jgi:hypothetical protein